MHGAPVLHHLVVAIKALWAANVGAGHVGAVGAMLCGDVALEPMPALDDRLAAVGAAVVAAVDREVGPIVTLDVLGRPG